MVERESLTNGGWPLIAATAAVASLWMAAAGLGFDWSGIAGPLLGCVALVGASAFYTHRRPDPRLAAALSAMAQIVAFTAAGATLSYAVAASSGPLWDDAFASWDRALGLDWPAYLAAVDAHPWLSIAYGLAYNSLCLQFVAVVTALGFGGRFGDLRAFVLAFIVATIAVILVSGVMPAVETYVHFGLAPDAFPRIPPTGSFDRAALLNGLRGGTVRVLSLPKAEGLITFPSLHAALAVLFLGTLWPVRRLRWPAVALNLVMIAATPIYGGHYFVDVLAGAVVAILSLVAASALVRRAPRGTSRDPLPEAVAA